MMEVLVKCRCCMVFAAIAIVALVGLAGVLAGCEQPVDPDVDTPERAWYETWHEVVSDNLFPKRAEHASVVFQDKLWVIGGNNRDESEGYDYNDVWYSEDGMNWERAVPEAPFQKRHGHQAFVYDDRIWLLGGRTQDDSDWWFWDKPTDVWYSENGVDWVRTTEEAAFGGVYQPAAGVYDGRMWVIGGSDSANRNVHSSVDGITWTLETDSPEFSARGKAQILDFDGKMWLIGGYPEIFDDWVYFTEDGENWTKVEHETIPYTQETFGHDAIVLDSRMWFFAGDDSEDVSDWNSNIIYHSADGETWTKATGSRLFTPRCQPTVEVFNNRVWIIGGNLAHADPHPVDDIIYYADL